MIDKVEAADRPHPRDAGIGKAVEQAFGAEIERRGDAHKGFDGGFDRRRFRPGQENEDIVGRENARIGARQRKVFFEARRAAQDGRGDDVNAEAMRLPAFDKAFELGLAPDKEDAPRHQLAFGGAGLLEFA